MWSRNLTKRGSIAFLFQLSIRWVLWSCYLLVVTSVLCFLLIEAHPAILELLKPERVAYYAIKATYVTDDQLVFVKRKRKYDWLNNWLTGGGQSLYGGNELSFVPEPYQSLIRKWSSQSGSSTEDGFPSNSSTAPFQVAVVGASYIEGGTFCEQLKDRTGLSIINLGRGLYGPYQYLQIVKRYTPVLQPRVVVVSLFAGNDIRDVHEYEKWKDTGQYYQFAGDQGRNIIYRYYAAMRDVLSVVRADVSEFVSRRLPSFHRFLVAIRDRLSAIGRYEKKALMSADLGYSDWAPSFGFVKIGPDELPMVFSYWNPPQPSRELLHTRAWRSLERIIATIKSDEQQSNVRVIWLVIPSKEQVYGRQARSSDRSSVEFKSRLAEQLKFEDNFSDAFREIADRLKLEYLDLLPAFRQLAPNCVLYYPTDTHWNIYGQRVAASLLSVLLLAERSEMKQPQLDLSNFGTELCGKASEYYN